MLEQRLLMNKIRVSIILSVLLSVASARAQQPSVPQPTQKELPNRQAEFFQKATNGSIFIYGPQVDPCAPLPEGRTLLPLGSGFVTGVEKRGASTPNSWSGWKFLVTAKHVLARQDEIIIRVNAAGESRFVCKKIKLETQGPSQNVIVASSGVDLEAIAMPEIAGADPTVVPSDILVDEARMKEWNIGVGTQVLTIGYLLGYSGQKANFPVAKFGHISLITDEAWYFNPESKLLEQGYVLDLSNAPGLSGAPVFAHGMEFEASPFRFRELPPYVVGIVKGLMLAPVNGQMISQGIAVIEPGANLKALMRQIAAVIKAGGGDVVDIP
jgi:hypothetical protein